MIIHKEQKDCVLPDGTPGKRLIVSYVNANGGVSYLNWPIPKSEMFEWRYTNRQNACPPEYVPDYVHGGWKKDENGNPLKVQWMSYDNKWVRKAPVTELPPNRVNELLCSFGEKLDPMFEMHVPNTWFCDIEVEVTDKGFPEPEKAETPINTISMSQFPRTIIWARKPLTLQEQQWVQKQIDGYSEDPQVCHDETKKDITKGYKFEFKCFPDERSMLKDFLEFCKDQTIAIAGWNFLNFDWLYIYNRAVQYNGLDMDALSPTHKSTVFKITPRSGGATIKLLLPMHRLIYDYLLVFKTWDQTVDHCENHQLDYIGLRVLGMGKKKHEWGFQDGYEKHFADYVFYNCIDTILLEQIDKQINTAKIWYMLASILRIDAYDAFSTIRPTETVMCNFVYPDYKVFPTNKKKMDAEQESYVGAFVWPTRPGVNFLNASARFAA